MTHFAVYWHVTICIFSFVVGAGVALLCLRGLWSSVHGLVARPSLTNGCHAHSFGWACPTKHAHARPWAWHPNHGFVSSAVLRLLLVSAVLCGLAACGFSALAAGLVGMWMARTWTVWHLRQGARHAP